MLKPFYIGLFRFAVMPSTGKVPHRERNKALAPVPHSANRNGIRMQILRDDMTKIVSAVAAFAALASLPVQAADKSCVAASLEYSEGMVLCYGEHIQLLCKDGQWQVTQAAPEPNKPPQAVIINACIGMAPALPLQPLLAPR